MRVMLGYDPAEHAAYTVARFSIERRTSRPVRVSPIVLSDLQRARLYTRPTTYNHGQLWDIVSGAPMSTEFAISRFFIPHLVDSDDDQWVLFADSDIVCLVDIAELFNLADPRFALYCVHQPPLWSTDTKKVNKRQIPYTFKNWSSVMLWNVKHPAHRALDISTLNTVPGRDLHAFSWLDFDLIGKLEPRWNWLVNVNPEPPSPAICHFTLGGPWLADWPTRGVLYDHIWNAEKARYDEAMANELDPR